MKKKIIGNVIFSVVMLLMLAAEVVAAYFVISLDILPTMYLGIMLGVLAVLFIGTSAIMFAHRKEKKVGVFRRVLACVLAAATIAGCCVATKVANDIDSTMNVIVEPQKIEGPSRNIYVRADDPAQTIADAAKYTFGVIEEYDVDCIQQTIDAVEAELGVTLTVVSFLSAPAAMDALYDGRVDALILNAAVLDALAENELYADVAEKTRVLHSVEVTQETSSTQTSKPTLATDITSEPFVVYLSGIDSDDPNFGRQRSDVNILMVVNPKTKQILLINTPRDTYVVHPYSSSGTRDKLTHCGIYGVECSMAALSNLYNVKVEYWAQINFTGFKKLIDEIGGITVYSDRAFTTCYDTPIVVGENNVDGRGALGFARDRYHQVDGDFGRGRNQMQVIRAVINKMTDGTTLISNYSGILESMDGMFATNMTTDEMKSLVKMQLSDLATWNIQSYALTGTGGRATTYSSPGFEAYVMYIGDSSRNKAASLIQKVMNGEILTEEDVA